MSQRLSLLGVASMARDGVGRARDAPPLRARRRRRGRERAPSPRRRGPRNSLARTQVPGHVLGPRHQPPATRKRAGRRHGTAAPQPPKKEPEPEPEPEVERTPEEQKAYDQKQLALPTKPRATSAIKRETDAACHYDDAIAADPGDVTYRNNKCAVHFEKKDYDAVLSEGREAIKVGREHRADYELVHKIYVRMGKAKMKQGDLEGALEEFNNAQVEHRDKATER